MRPSAEPQPIGQSTRGAQSVPGTAASHVQPALEEGTLLNGRYRVVRVLGAGAFGRVYLAEDAEDPANPPLAIKELLAREFTSLEEQRDAISWFKREVSTLLTLEHPGIPGIHGYWTAHRATGPLYLAMDFIPGKTLADIQVLSLGKLHWTQVFQWGIELCDVLGYLHSRMPPYVFRDLKPANVLVHEQTGSPVLIDFGLARQLLPVNGTAIGTWGYVPFEQVLGKAEPRSDLYSLGAVLHELLTNRHPDVEYRQLLRSGLDVESALRALFPRADQVSEDVPAEAGDVLVRAAAFLPDERFPDAAALRRALEAALHTADRIVRVDLAVRPSNGRSPTFQSTTERLSRRSESPTSGLSSLLKPLPSTAELTRSVEEEALASDGLTPATQPPVAPRSGESTPPREPVPDGSERVAPAPLANEALLPLSPMPLDQGPSSLNGTSLSESGRLVLRPPAAKGQGNGASAPEDAAKRGRWWVRPSMLGSRGTGDAQRSQITVSSRGEGQFLTIAAALQAARPGTRILIEPGHYREGIVIDSDVELVGAGSADQTIVEAIGSACVLMRASQATVRNLTLQCRGGTGEHRFYAVNVPGGRLVLEDCIVVSDSLAAIALHGRTADPVIRRCTVRSAADRGVVVYGHAGGLFDRCDIAGNTICVRVSSQAAPTFQSCRIHGGKHGGVTFVENAHGTLEDCDIQENGHHGVACRTESTPLIRRCRINRNGWSAISILDTSGATVEFCDLTGNKSGPWNVQETARVNVNRRGNKET